MLKNFRIASYNGKKYLISAKDFNSALFIWYLRVNEKIISVERIFNDTQFKIMKNLKTFEFLK